MNFKKFLVTDWPRKTVALVCAFLIWYTVYRQIQEKEIFRDIPITLKYGKNLTVSEEKLPKVNLTLRGPKRKLSSLTNADIKIIGKVNYGATTGGYYTVALREKNIKIPSGIKIDEIQPSSFQVLVDIVSDADVPIRCRFSGRLAEGYDRKSFNLIPKTVQISGPSKIVKRIKEVRTESIELDDSIQDDFEIDVRLETIRNVSIIPDFVRVTVELYKKYESKFFGNLNLVVLNSTNTDFFVEEFLSPANSKVEAVLNGPKSTIDFLTSSSIRTFIDISNISVFGSYRLPVHLWVDAKDCSVVEVRPMIVEVKISSRPK